MSEIGQSTVLPAPRNPWESDLLNMLREFIESVTRILNRGIRFADNVDCAEVEYTSNATPGTEDTIPHGLGRVPQGFLIYDRDADSNDPYRSTAYDATNIYVKCGTASVAFKLIIF